MAGRETRIPKGSVSHRRSGIHRVFSHIAHKRRNVRFKGARRVHTRHPGPEPRTQRLTGRNTGRFRWGRYHYPRSVLRGSETLRGRVSERHTLPFCAREECVGKKQRAFWTSTHALCVDVQRRRGPVGTRSPAAGSCAVLVSFTVCHRCIQEQREKFAVGVAWFLLAA